MNKIINNQFSIITLLQSKPQAIAVIKGNDKYPDIYGIIRFYQTQIGILIFAEVIGLPKENSKCSQKVFGFHIHSGTSCTGNASDTFADAMAHYNPNNCSHPSHSGDMPPLFGNSGKALSVFLTNRFTIDEVIGKTVIIHENPDDLITQPSGNSGNKIACGIIRNAS